MGHNLSIASWQVHLEQVLRLQEDSLGADHIDVAGTLTHLAHVEENLDAKVTPLFKGHVVVSHDPFVFV